MRFTNTVLTFSEFPLFNFPESQQALVKAVFGAHFMVIASHLIIL